MIEANCLIKKPRCGLKAGNPMCAKCGLDTRVGGYTSQQAGEAARQKAVTAWDHAEQKEQAELAELERRKAQEAKRQAEKELLEAQERKAAEAAERLAKETAEREATERAELERKNRSARNTRHQVSFQKYKTELQKVRNFYSLWRFALFGLMMGLATLALSELPLIPALLHDGFTNKNIEGTLGLLFIVYWLFMSICNLLMLGDIVKAIDSRLHSTFTHVATLIGVSRKRQWFDSASFIHAKRLTVADNLLVKCLNT